jgi:hypothetical protein
LLLVYREISFCRLRSLAQVATWRMYQPLLLNEHCSSVMTYRFAYG